MIEELFTPASDASFHTLFCTQTRRIRRRRRGEAPWEEEWEESEVRSSAQRLHTHIDRLSHPNHALFNWIQSYFINNLFHFYLPWHCCVFQKKNCLENVKWLYWNKHRLWHNPEIVSKLILSSGDRHKIGSAFVQDADSISISSFKIWKLVFKIIFGLVQ